MTGEEGAPPYADERPNNTVNDRLMQTERFEIPVYFERRQIICPYMVRTIDRMRSELSNLDFDADMA